MLREYNNYKQFAIQNIIIAILHVLRVRKGQFNDHILIIHVFCVMVLSTGLGSVDTEICVIANRFINTISVIPVGTRIWLKL